MVVISYLIGCIRNKYFDISYESFRHVTRGYIAQVTFILLENNYICCVSERRPEYNEIGYYI